MPTPQRLWTILAFLFLGPGVLQLGCGGGGHSAQSGATLPPTISHFTATPPTISPGASVTLAWSVSGADSLRIDQGIGVVAGTSYSVTPIATTTYMLTASNMAGSSTATATVVVGGGPAAPGIWVMGYYVGYHAGLQPPASVDYSTMTHVMVGGVLPRTGGTFDTTFYIDPANGPAWAKETVQRAHQAGIKAILMVGGAGDANIAAFREVSNAAIRATFVQNLKAIVESYGFDGVDMDWEPLEMGPAPTPDDRSTLLALSQDLRSAMPTKIFTIPVGWNNANFDNMADAYYGNLAQFYDRVNMMSYGMNVCGYGWNTWHSSALFGETGHTPSSVDNTTKALIRAGVPRAKIGIGMGFYGQPYENAHWVNGSLVYATSGFVTAPGQNSDNTVVRFSDNDVSYANIMRYYYEPTALQWDDTAKASYLSFSVPKRVAVPAWTTIQTTYLTYEDERSIAAKGQFVKQQGLGGVIIWTISEGYLDWKTTGEKDPLMKATKAAFLP